ncbi:hypothetical protein Tco_0967524 [Tanacetum coccineum]
MSKSAWTEKDQIDNFLKERRVKVFGKINSANGKKFVLCITGYGFGEMAGKLGEVQRLVQNSSRIRCEKIIEIKQRVVRFGKRGKLNPRYVGPFKVLEKVGSVAYKLELPQELSRVHNTFHVSNLKKCYANEPLAVSLDELHFDDKL